jgi:predicted membrane protein
MPIPPRSVPPGVSLLHSDSVPDRNGVVGIGHRVKREGQWVLPRHFRVLAVMGGVDLDLTNVILGEGESMIEAVGIMGSVRILVPPGLRVEIDRDSTYGKFRLQYDAMYDIPAGAPVIRITGRAIFGDVDVRVAEPANRGWVKRFLGG